MADDLEALAAPPTRRPWVFVGMAGVAGALMLLAGFGLRFTSTAYLSPWKLTESFTPLLPLGRPSERGNLGDAPVRCVRPGVRETSYSTEYWVKKFDLPPDNERVPNLIHGVWMANPIKPYHLASIDSVIRYIPDVTYKLHVITPQGANSTMLDAIRLRFEEQLEPVLALPNFDFRLVLHHNIEAELKGLPLDGLGITQEHWGGLVENMFISETDKKKKRRMLSDRGGSPHGHHTTAMVHAADVFRVVTVYREGGVYFDTDQILLGNPMPIIQSVGAMSTCETHPDARGDGRCKMCNSFIAAPPEHPFFWDLMERAAMLIKERGVNSVFQILPFRNGAKQIWWTAMGPDLFAKVKNRWIDEKKDVWVVGGGMLGMHTVKNLRRRPQWGKYPDGMPTSMATSFTVIGRKYFAPTSWSQQTLQHPLTPGQPEEYSRAFAFHLWEMSGAGNWIRPHYVDVVYNTTDSLLHYLHHKFCLLFCDPLELVRKTKPFEEYMMRAEGLHPAVGIGGNANEITRIEIGDRDENVVEGESEGEDNEGADKDQVNNDQANGTGQGSNDRRDGNAESGHQEQNRGTPG